MATRIRLNRHLRLGLLGALCCLGIGSAQAAWEVTDQQTHQTLDKIRDSLGKGDITQKLDDIHNSQKLGSSSKTGEMEPEPTGEEALDHARPSTIEVGGAERCPAASSSALATQQHQICEEIVKTERARYLFSLRMYKLTRTRHERLHTLEQDREALHDEDQGLLQDNSNKLLALMSLMQIDQQQHCTYMAAYDARMTYLVQARDALTRQALEGSGSGGSFDLAALTAALGG